MKRGASASIVLLLYSRLCACMRLRVEKRIIAEICG
jgi:hypothetical protein